MTATTHLCDEKLTAVHMVRGWQGGGKVQRVTSDPHHPTSNDLPPTSESDPPPTGGLGSTSFENAGLLPFVSYSASGYA